MKYLFKSKLWTFLCSLKLTIVLASSATLVAVVGSLFIPFNPQVFSVMDSMPLGLWIGKTATQFPAITWWVPFGGILVMLLGINAFCCFVDWVFHIGGRWRKTGEYLIHLGFVLIVIAFVWGSQSGFRSEKKPLLVGQQTPIPQLGMTLKLENFEPKFTNTGRPIDMLNTLALFQGERLVKRVVAKTNHPLTWKGLVVVPASYGQVVRSGRYLPYSILTINYDPGVDVALAGAICVGTGVILTLFSFYRKRRRGDHPNII